MCVLLLLEDSEAEDSEFRGVTSGSVFASLWDSFTLENFMGNYFSSFLHHLFSVQEH